MRSSLTLSVILIFLPAAGAAAGTDRPDRPDIVIILADDVGSGDLSCYGASDVRTPNLDGIAQRGVRFTSAYAPSAVCSPTRYAMLTGRYPWRDGVTEYLESGSTLLFRPERETLASYLRARGYATAAFGKWHLGLGSPEAPYALDPGPLDAGFDRFFGLVKPPDAASPHWVLDRRWVGWDHGAVVDLTGASSPGIARALPENIQPALLSQIEEFVREEAGRPVFLWIATRQVHKPWLTGPGFGPDPGEGQYIASLRELDWLVGEILAMLDSTGRRRDALVVFASDNGAGQDALKSTAGRHRPNAELRGYKGNVWEGGIRVPLLIEWPAVLGGGIVRDDPVSLVDVAATAAAALGDEVPAVFGEDGIDLLRFPTAGEARTRPVIAASLGGRAFAVRRGEWKLVRSNRKSSQLFDLARDPGETSDLAGERPEVVAALLELLDAGGVPPPDTGAVAGDEDRDSTSSED